MLDLLCSLLLFHPITWTDRPTVCMTCFFSLLVFSLFACVATTPNAFPSPSDTYQSFVTCPSPHIKTYKESFGVVKSPSKPFPVAHQVLWCSWPTHLALTFSVANWGARHVLSWCAKPMWLILAQWCLLGSEFGSRKISVTSDQV